MAKTSSVMRNNKRIAKVTRKLQARLALKEIIRNNTEDRDEAMLKLQKSKRNENPIRIRNRCRHCGRPRGTLRKFGLCRIHLREAAMRGDVPGLRKASW